MNDKEKISKYLKYKGISKNKFYKKTGLSMGFLDSGASLGVDKLRLIINNYLDLSLDWIITGKGEMLRSRTLQDSMLSLINLYKHVKRKGVEDFTHFFFIETPTNEMIRTISTIYNHLDGKESTQKPNNDVIIGLKGSDGYYISYMSIYDNSWQAKITIEQKDISKFLDDKLFEPHIEWQRVQDLPDSIYHEYFVVTKKNNNHIEKVIEAKDKTIELLEKQLTIKDQRIDELLKQLASRHLPTVINDVQTSHASTGAEEVPQETVQT